MCGRPGAMWPLPCAGHAPQPVVRCHTEDSGLSLCDPAHSRSSVPSCCLMGGDTGVAPGSAVCACPGAAVWVWLHVSPFVLRTCVCVSMTIAVRAACVCGVVCVSFWILQLCREPLQCVGGRHLVPSRQDGFRPHCLPQPLDAIRDCFHPPSTASGTLDFAPEAPTEAPSSLLSLGHCLPGRHQWPLVGFTWDVVLVPGGAALSPQGLPGFSSLQL